MAFTTLKNFLTMTFRDARDNERVRVVELGGLVVVTDDNANDFHNASKSAVIKYVQNNVQNDPALTADADSEVRDTLRLYFRMPDEGVYHMDIPDPHDEVFLAASGPGANILKERAELVLDIGGPGEAVDSIIADALAGEYLISDGEQPTGFLYGERVTWR